MNLFFYHKNYLLDFYFICIFFLYLCLYFYQLRTAIEEVNSGNPTCNQATQTPPEKPPLEPQEVPLLNNQNEKDNQNTIDSMDSALSNSENCSDIELGNPIEHKTEPK